MVKQGQNLGRQGGRTLDFRERGCRRRRRWRRWNAHDMWLMMMASHSVFVFLYFVSLPFFMFFFFVSPETF